MQSVSLPTALEGIDLACYDALVIDTQGTELLILEGAAPLLPRFKYIKTEAADFELYKNCASERDIVRFLSAHGFRVERKEFLPATYTHPSGGRCLGAVGGVVGIEGGVVSGVINLESSGVGASDWRPRHEKHYQEV